MKKMMILVAIIWSIFCFSEDIPQSPTPADKTSQNTKTSKISISHAFGAVLGSNIEENIKHGGKGPLALDISQVYGGDNNIFNFNPKNPVTIKQGNKSYDVGYYTLCITPRYRIYKIIVDINIGPSFNTIDSSNCKILNPESHINKIVLELQQKYGDFNFIYRKKQKYSDMEEVGELSDPRLLDRKIIVTKSKTSISIEYYAGDIEKQDRLPESISGGNL